MVEHELPVFLLGVRVEAEGVLTMPLHLGVLGRDEAEVCDPLLGDLLPNLRFVGAKSDIGYRSAVSVEIFLFRLI